MRTDDVIVYYKPGCPFGIKLRLAMSARRVPHRSVRFRDDKPAAAAVRDVTGGYEISPTVRIGGRYLPNPSLSQVRQAIRRTR